MILLLEDLHPDAEALLAAVAPLVHAPAPRGLPEEMATAAQLVEVRAILTRGRGLVDAALMDACPSLQVIARPGAGTDNLAVDHAAARGIPTVHAPGVNARTVAEHTMALILASVRGVARSAAAVAAGRWGDRMGYDGQEVGGLTLGIIGHGMIGRRVAALAHAFEMNVVVAAHPSVAADVATLPMADLLATADVVTIHTPLTAETQSLLGTAEIASMKPGAHLINTGRGDLVDGAALRLALAEGRLGGFAADVLDHEPPAADDPLLADDRVVLTPHVASLTGTTYRELCLSAARNVAAILRGEVPDPGSIRHPATR